ncbi:MAG: hypothetical protein LAT64_06700 [Phycisphaerales bacterium]|nr:hypothetical protein [Planctomycetota bacterium]MCH8508444.1 hypothetical protein [Phycisphaerales bacterium]
MARKKSSRSKKPRKAPKDPERAARNRRFAIAAVLGLGAVASFVGASAGLDAVERRATAHLTPGDPDIIVHWPRDPATDRVWLPLTERDRLGSVVVRAASGGRALSREPLEEIGRVLFESGWFDRPPTVRWTHDAQIVVEGRWRVPVAAVRLGAKEYLIDYDARVLPLDFPSGQSNMIFLLNPSQPLVATGQTWAGEDIKAALDLILLLQKENLLEQVAGIDLGQGRQSGVLSILSDRGARVIWGGGPNHLRPAEQPTSVKLARLRALLDRTGRIDASVDLVDLRPQQPLIERSPG